MNLPLDSTAIPSVAARADAAPSPEALAMIDRLLAEIRDDGIAAGGIDPNDSRAAGVRIGPLG